MDVVQGVLSFFPTSGKKEKKLCAVLCVRLALISPRPQRNACHSWPRVTLTRSPASISTLLHPIQSLLTPIRISNAVPDLPHLRRAHRPRARAPANAVCVPSAAAAKVPAGEDMPQSARVLRFAEVALRKLRVGPHRPAQGRAERRGGEPRCRPYMRCDRGPWPRAGEEDEDEDEDEEARPCVSVSISVCETGA